MIEGEKLLIGGNSIYVWLGIKLNQISKWLSKKGEEFIYKGTPRIVTNPEAEFINPFLILVKFTVDNTDKYQIVLQNNFIERYKEDKNLEKFTIEEKYAVIRENQKLWYKKQIET